MRFVRSSSASSASISAGVAAGDGTPFFVAEDDNARCDRWHDVKLVRCHDHCFAELAQADNDLYQNRFERGSRLAVGSSSRIASGSIESTLAIATRFFSPPDSS